MSITNELRKWGYGFCGDTHDVVTAIADRIDAEHEAQLGVLYRDMSDAEWVRLPKDADGVPIRIGDVMEGVDKYDSLKKVKGEVITVSFESDGIVDVAIQAWNSDGKSWHRAYLDSGASVYRHYHAPTVEDVLCDLLNEYRENECTLVEARLSEYATKLRMAEGEDE